MARELGTIVEYIDLLKDYDAPPPPPMDSPVEDLEADDPWVLDDQPRSCLPRELLLANAPAAVDGQVAVPRMFADRGEDQDD